MIQLQLYIEDERVDLFEDESIVVTDSIKDLKDITKIYTAFSQQFNLPASKTNNKIFKHYYDYDIINGYDARVRKNAILKVNGSDYKIGKIQLNSVDLKDNKPYSYKVVFYGNTVTLKDLLGDDKLEDLDLSAYDHDYDGTNQIDGIETELFAGVIKYPLISHTKNFDVDTTNGVYEFGTTNVPSYSDFKPAIQLNAILSAIETKYGLTFGNNFFASDYFDELYLWLHRAKGLMANADEETQLITNQDDFSFVSGDDLISDGLITGCDNQPFCDDDYRFKFEWEVTIASGDYQVKVVDALQNEEILTDSGSGTQTFTFYLQTSQLREWDLNFIITSDSVLGLTQDLTVSREVLTFFSWITVDSGVYEKTLTDSENQVVISQQMPKVKTIDFLTNLFKMHNLVAFIERLGFDEIIQVEDLPLYYNEYNTYEISKYVDVKKVSVEKFYPYKQISFIYEGQKTILTEALNDFKELDDFGNLSYIDATPQDKDAGSYEIKVAFEKVYFERLLYTDTGAASNIQWGYFVDKDQNPIVNKPLILMIENRSAGSDLEINDGTTDQSLSTYNAPVNNKTINGVPYSLHFGLELDEWSGSQIDEDSTLFKRYYENYIRRIYHQQSRKMVCTAYLPMHILLNYNLDDTFYINNKLWKIESIKTNFLKQESKLTLFNDINSIIALEQGINPNAERIANLSKTISSGTEVDLTWDAVTDADQYIIYNGIYQIDTSATNSYTLTVSDTKYSFKIGVQTEFTDGTKSPIKYINTL